MREIVLARKRHASITAIVNCANLITPKKDLFRIAKENLGGKE